MCTQDINEDYLVSESLSSCVNVDRYESVDCNPMCVLDLYQADIEIFPISRPPPNEIHSPPLRQPRGDASPRANKMHSPSWNIHSDAGYSTQLEMPPIDSANLRQFLLAIPCAIFLFSLLQKATFPK
ncbi:hypothetical protein CDAR_620861 [Caerostris darwini]|uniref:Uncharacterized protein n=1 Tax=Caerostris darwini TaxID=1538125 RepID=A0AAV4URU0_9ARAC|nr:hypothetical protein CDAR_620861 [Caerostris darwini]